MATEQPLCTSPKAHTQALDRHYGVSSECVCVRERQTDRSLSRTQWCPSIQVSSFTVRTPVEKHAHTPPLVLDNSVVECRAPEAPTEAPNVRAVINKQAEALDVAPQCCEVERRITRVVEAGAESRVHASAAVYQETSTSLIVAVDGDVQRCHRVGDRTEVSRAAPCDNLARTPPMH